jgi:hypothetical protein
LKKIGLLSDTHGYVHPATGSFFGSCDEIWHAGDIGDLLVTDQLSAISKVVAVFGNIDGHHIRQQFPEVQIFEAERKKVLMMHIGGYPGKYARGVQNLLVKHQPDIFICGHSHILRVMYDKKNNLLFINPGAAGKHGMHQKITLVRFELHEGTISNLEIYEAERNRLKE